MGFSYARKDNDWNLWSATAQSLFKNKLLCWLYRLFAEIGIQLQIIAQITLGIEG